MAKITKKIYDYTFLLKSLVDSEQDAKVKQEIISVAKAIAKEFGIDVSGTEGDLFKVIKAGLPEKVSVAMQNEILKMLKDVLSNYGAFKARIAAYEETIPEPEVAAGEVIKAKFLYKYNYDSAHGLTISKINPNELQETIYSWFNQGWNRNVTFTKITADTLLNFDRWDAGIAVAAFKYWMDAHLNKDPEFKPDLLSKIFSLDNEEHVIEFFGTMMNYNAKEAINYGFLEANSELIAEWIESLYEAPIVAEEYDL